MEKAAVGYDEEAVAEGAETEGQTRLLKEMGGDMAQGFHFAEALPPRRCRGSWPTQPPPS